MLPNHLAELPDIAQKAIREFGFDLLPPWPGRVADRLSDILYQMEEGDDVTAELRRLILALDARSMLPDNWTAKRQPAPPVHLGRDRL